METLTCKSPYGGRMLVVSVWGNESNLCSRKGKCTSVALGSESWLFKSKKNSRFHFPMSWSVGCTVNLKCKIAQVMCQLLQLLLLCHLLSLMASSVSESTLDILLLLLSQSVFFFPPSSWTVRSVLVTLTFSPRSVAFSYLVAVIQLSTAFVFSCSVGCLPSSNVWWLLWLVLGSIPTLWSPQPGICSSCSL